jgi:hypothetical protein
MKKAYLCIINQTIPTMNENKLSFAAIKTMYPNEWVLVGNPLLHQASVAEGLVVFHHESKRAVCEFARSIITQFEMVKIVFTGDMPKVSRLGIFKVTEEK